MEKLRSLNSVTSLFSEVEVSEFRDLTFGSAWLAALACLMGFFVEGYFCEIRPRMFFSRLLALLVSWLCSPLGFACLLATLVCCLCLCAELRGRLVMLISEIATCSGRKEQSHQHA